MCNFCVFFSCLVKMLKEFVLQQLLKLFALAVAVRGKLLVRKDSVLTMVVPTPGSKTLGRPVGVRDASWVPCNATAITVTAISVAGFSITLAVSLAVSVGSKTLGRPV